MCIPASYANGSPTGSNIPVVGTFMVFTISMAKILPKPCIRGKQDRRRVQGVTKPYFGQLSMHKDCVDAGVEGVFGALPDECAGEGVGYCHCA